MKYSKLYLAKEAIQHRGFISKIPAMFRMFRAWKKGIYKANFIDMMLPILGIAYIISPIDLIPGLLVPVVGLVDDLVVLSLVLPKLIREIDKFLIWETEQNLEVIRTK